MAGWIDAMNPISTGLGAIGSFSSGLLQQNANKKMMREQMAWNTKEREASQDFTRAERLAQQGYQTSEREAQNEWSEQLYNQYQSPEALRRQYSAAGLDPAMAINGGSTAGSASGSSGSAPTGASSPTLGVAPPYQNMNAFAQGFGEIANAMKSLADAKKAGMDTFRMEKLLAGEQRAQELQNLSAEFHLSSDKEWLNAERGASFKKLLMEIIKEGATIDSIKHQAEVFKKEAGLKGKQLEWFDKDMESVLKNRESQTDLNRSQISLNSVQEKVGNSYKMLLDSQLLTEGEKRKLMESQTRLNNVLHDINNIDYNVKSNTEGTQIKLTDKQLEVVDEQINLLQQQANKLMKEGKYYEWSMVIQSISAVGSLIPGVNSLLNRSSGSTSAPSLPFGSYSVSK